MTLLSGCGGGGGGGGAPGGTAQGPRSGTAVFAQAADGARSAAYDGTNFVVGLQSFDPNTVSTPIGVTLVSAAGVPLVSPTMLSNVGDTPSVACGGTTCLMAWASHDDAATDGSIKGRLLSSAGGTLSLTGSTFTIQASTFDSPSTGDSDTYRMENQSVVWDGKNFLVVFTHVHQPAPNTGPSSSEVQGWFVDTSGSDVGSVLQFSATPKTGDETGSAVVAYDGSSQNHALVVWFDATSNSTQEGTICQPNTGNQQYAALDVFGRFVSQSGTGAAGTVDAGTITIQNDGLRKIRGGPTVAFSDYDVQFLVAWNTETSEPTSCPDNESPQDGPTKLQDNFVDTNGGTTLGITDLGTSATRPALPQAGYDPTSKNVVLVWSDFRNDANANLTCDAGESTCADIWGQSHSYDNTPSNETALISDTGDQFEGFVAAGGGKLLLFWDDGTIAVNGHTPGSGYNTERDLSIASP